MYTIKEAAARTGVSVPVLRAWERRYGIVAPARTASGYRMYDEAALKRLRTMRRLVEGGWSPSIAAAAIRSGAPEVVPFADDPGPLEAINGSARPVEAPDAAPPDEPVVRYIAAASALDAPRVEQALDDMFAAGSFERAVEDHVLPALHELGDAWAAGRVDVAGEHLASHAMLRRLAAAYQAAAGDAAAMDGPVLVGLPAGARHELGGLIFATAARRAGLPVLYLGPDLPLEDWLLAVSRTGARAVVVGAVTPEDATSARKLAVELRRRHPELVIAFGGAAAPDPRSSRSLGRATLRLPEDVRGSVAALAAALSALPIAESPPA
ncbi:MAG TPA: MerR family transcriptional regulator [Candidatus Limnocylindrales bacterium]|nr:MerR family transcriptional regulator [Candidatus Limnocylindrales bacterium]